MSISFRVVVTGAESTGKSTLARELSESFGAPLLPERLRAWVDEAGRLPSAKDLGEVAQAHIRTDDELQSTNPPLLIYDTDLATLAIYWNHYFGGAPAWLTDEMYKRRPDLYLLMSDDIPWAPDPQRDGPGVREMLQIEFIARIPGLAPTISIAGNPKERLRRASKAITDAMVLHQDN